MSYHGSLKECWIVSLLNHFALFSGQPAFLMCLQSLKVFNVCVCFLHFSQACVRIRIKGEKAPELLLELQDDDRTQTFLTQVKSAQQQGKTQLPVSRLKQFDDELFNHSSKIYPLRVDYTTRWFPVYSCHWHAGGNAHLAASFEIRSTSVYAARKD